MEKTKVIHYRAGVLEYTVRTAALVLKNNHIKNFGAYCALSEAARYFDNPEEIPGMPPPQKMKFQTRKSEPFAGDPADEQFNPEDLPTAPGPIPAEPKSEPKAKAKATRTRKSPPKKED